MPFRLRKLQVLLLPLRTEVEVGDHEEGNKGLVMVVLWSNTSDKI
jgi:hypothetical protein